MPEEVNAVTPVEGATPEVKAPETFNVDSLNKLEGDAFIGILPEEIRSKPYLKDVKNFTGLVKKLDGAQTLLGQRTMPGADATPEQWEAFLSKMRPEKPTDYVLPTIEGVDAEYVKNTVGSPIFTNLLHKAHASPYQAKILMEGLTQVLLTSEKEEKARQDKVLEDTTTQLFGDKKDLVLENGKKFLATTIPEAMRPLVNELDSKTLALVLGITDGVVRKYTGEDPYRSGGSGGSGTAQDTKESLVKEMQEIQKDPAYLDPYKDRVKNKELNIKMEDIRARMRKIL